MKAIQFKLIGALAMSLSACACIPSVEAPVASPEPAPTIAQPAPPTPPQPTPAPAPAPPAELSANWIDRPVTGGSWRYSAEPDETIAVFSAPNGRPLAIIRCDRQTRMVGLGRHDNPSTQSVEMLIGTETRRMRLSATQRAPEIGLVAAEIDARNPLLDAIALTRGRFAMALSGQPTLHLPAWAEVTRVIEDCR